MPRKPRIEIAGYYHIVNRGVNQSVVFQEADDEINFQPNGAYSRTLKPPQN